MFNQNCFREFIIAISRHEFWLEYRIAYRMMYWEETGERGC